MAAIKSSIEELLESLREDGYDSGNIVFQQAKDLEGDLRELHALRMGARTGLLQFMMAGDVGAFVDRMKQHLQALVTNDNYVLIEAADRTLVEFFRKAEQETKRG